MELTLSSVIKGLAYKPCSLKPHSPRGKYRQSNECWSSRENTNGKEWLLSHKLVKLLDVPAEGAVRLF